MIKANCLNCKYAAYKLISRMNPEESSIYCIKWTRMVIKDGYCADYQEDSRYTE